MCINKVHCMYFQVRTTMVVTLVEVLSDCVINFLGCNIVQMALEPIHEAFLCLTYILY